jgi:hypothetical protein
LPIHEVFAFNAVSAQAVKLTDPAASPAAHANTASQLLNVKRSKVDPPVSAALGHEPARIKNQLMWRATQPEATQENRAADSCRKDGCAAARRGDVRGRRPSCHDRRHPSGCLTTRAVCGPRAVPDMPIRTAHITRKKRRDENRK